MVNYSSESLKIIERVKEIARELNHKYVGTYFLLSSIFKDGNNEAHRLILKHADCGQLESMIEKIGKPLDEDVDLSQLIYSRRLYKVINEADFIRHRFGQDKVGSLHLLYGLINEKESLACEILEYCTVGKQVQLYFSSPMYYQLVSF